MPTIFQHDDPVRVADGREGSVFNHPRAGSPNIRVLINGLATPRYFPASQLTKITAPASAGTIEQFPTSPAPDELAVPATGPQLTLPELVDLCARLRSDLRDLETLVLRIQIEDALAKHLGGAMAQLASLRPVYAASDAEKVKLDTARALAAAKRLFPTKTL